MACCTSAGLTEPCATAQDGLVQSVRIETKQVQTHESRQWEYLRSALGLRAVFIGVDLIGVVFMSEFYQIPPHKSTCTLLNHNETGRRQGLLPQPNTNRFLVGDYGVWIGSHRDIQEVRCRCRDARQGLWQAFWWQASANRASAGHTV